MYLFQEADSRGEGSGASAGQSAHHAAAAVRPPEVPRRISGVGPAVRPQLLFVRPAEPPTLGRGQGIEPKLCLIGASFLWGKKTSIRPTWLSLIHEMDNDMFGPEIQSFEWMKPSQNGEWCLCWSKERLWNQSFNLLTVRLQQGDRAGVPLFMLLLVLSTRISDLQYITKKKNNHGETFYFICIVMCFWVLTT